MVWPLMLVTTSPGLTARPLGMFSQAGIRPTTLTAGLSSASAAKVPSTLAAPPMSNFISSISAAGLIEMPPVSKVTPLPTSTTGATDLCAPWYFSTMKRSGCSEPWDTAMKAPMPKASTSAGPRISALRCDFLASWRAASASSVGVAWLAGRFAHSLASSMPRTVAQPSSKPERTAPASVTPRSTRRIARGCGRLLVAV